MEKATKTLFLVVLLGCIFALNTYAAEPEEIYTAEQLNDVRNNLAGSYILMSDIDLSDTVWGEVYAGEYGTSGWEPIGSQASPFRGSFDGNGYTITGLFIDKPNVNEVGLFGNTAASATIEGLRLGDVNVTGKMDVGGLVGLNEGIITNCYVTGSVKGTAEEIGGLVGYHKNAGTITNSYSACAVEGTHFLGGLIGRNEAPISNSYATGDVYGILAGTSSAVGGLVGRNADGIINSYATGNVTGGSNVGGLIGYNWSDMNVEYSYATGAVEGTTKVGGLIGSINVNGTGTVLNSYYNSCTTGQTEDDSGNGEPKTSTEMVQTDTFIDWDFTNTWNINEWESYPRLKWSSHVPAPPAATAVTVSSASVELTYGGGPTTLTAAVEPVCAIQKVTWSTSNSDVATVDENGVVTPIGAGEATITATPVSGDVVGETAVTVGKKELTVSGTFTAGDKVYDGSTTAVIDASSLTLSGVVGGDNVELSTSAVFANKNVAENITVNLTSDNSLIGDDAGNYTLSLTGAPISTANITAMELTVINAAAQDKVYDGTADAIIDGAQLSGVVDGDSVTLEDHTVGIFAQATVGTGIGVTTNMTITGDDADNYTIAQPGLLTANITAKELTVINAVAQEKVYDRTTDADIINAELSGVVDGDSVTLENHTVGTFAQAAIGTGIGVTTNMTITGDDVENYTIAQPVLTADITTKELTIINAAAQNKIYDGTDNAVIGGAQLSGVVGSDDVTLGNHTVGTFAQAAIGTGIGVTTNMTITGDDAGNYTIAQPVLATANITAKELTVINAEAQDKVYDGTADADIINAELSGVVDGDSVTLENNDAGTFAQATVGTGIEVTTNMTITGDDAGNYTIAQPVLSADITAKELTIGGTFTAEDKIYDGNTTVVIDDSDLTLTGVVDGDSVVLNAAAAFADANAADYIVVSLTDASSISGEDSGNYSLSLLGAPTTTADITPPPSDSKAITDFSLEAFEPDIQAVIDEGAKTITMEVPFGTDVTALVPTIEHTGADIIPASGVVQDFTNPVTYEVTAENNTTAVYTVTMSVALPSNEACLTNLVISSGILNPAFVPDIQAYTADVANSTADITVTSTAAHPGASIEVNMTAVVSGEASQAIALNVGVNTINIIVTAEDGTERIYEVTVNRASSDSDNDDDRDNDDDNDRNTSISEPEPTTSSNITINVNGNSITSAASVDSETGTVTAVLNESAINNALTESQDDGQGVDTVDIKIPKTTGANYYVTELPATVLTGNNTTRIEINSELGTITLPGNMLGDEGAYGIDNVGLSIGTVDKSAIDEKVRTQIGDKPVIELKLKSKEGTISWNNPDAPVTVSIPYTPTEKELSDPEHITVWYIDGEGNVIEVPTGRYNPVTGMVTFSTTHFSNYAVVYVTKTFDDLENAAWGKKSIEVLASKGVMKGVSEKEFEPQSNITRADFLYSLIRTLGVEARFDGNFDDISKDDYYYKEIGIAQRMGITKGTGNNKFNPEESITRQDMMVLTERALRMFKRIEAQGAASDLDKFADKSLIADYAVNSVASVVKEGLIVGSGDGVNPLGNTTRAETAVFLYRIYNK